MGECSLTRNTMERYLIETPHTAQDCQMLVDQVYAMGFLNHFDWGCESGVHSGWAIVEADNENDARLAVPSMIRNKARVVKLNKFSNHDEIEADINITRTK